MGIRRHQRISTGFIRNMTRRRRRPRTTLRGAGRTYGAPSKNQILKIVGPRTRQKAMITIAQGLEKSKKIINEGASPNRLASNIPVLNTKARTMIIARSPQRDSLHINLKNSSRMSTTKSTIGNTRESSGQEVTPSQRTTMPRASSVSSRTGGSAPKRRKRPIKSMSPMMRASFIS